MIDNATFWHSLCNKVSSDFSKVAFTIKEANGIAVQLCLMGIKKTVPVRAGTVSLLYENEYGTVQAPYLQNDTFSGTLSSC